ncbi:MAG: alpha/beta fold hydrolase [Planctomycetaceae bacterium]
MSDEDDIVLHDDRPDDWEHGDQVALLMHGISGCHGSGYMMRIAGKLNRRSVRSFRMDHRGCGAGEGLAENPYHAGRIDDLHRAIHSIENLCPGSSISIVGFSLSGNLLLRYLGDRSFDHSPNVFRAAAVCPPVDLRFCVKQLSRTRAGQRYDRYFTRRLISQVSGGRQWRDDLPLAQVRRLPRRLYDFDEMYTAPASGFDSADEYYRFASARDYLSMIDVPTTVLAAQDDPLVSPEPFSDLKLPSTVTLCLTEHGGHLGFVGRQQADPDRRWMDWRVIDWLLN